MVRSADTGTESSIDTVPTYRRLRFQLYSLLLSVVAQLSVTRPPPPLSAQKVHSDAPSVGSVASRLRQISLWVPSVTKPDVMPLSGPWAPSRNDPSEVVCEPWRLCPPPSGVPWTRHPLQVHMWVVSAGGYGFPYPPDLSDHRPPSASS